MEIRTRQSATIRDLFQLASLDSGCWRQGLEALAQATGSLRAQLLGVDGNGELVFNVMTQVDSDLQAAFAGLPGHHDPAVNYRMATSIAAAPGQLISESHYSEARARIGETAYDALCEKHGLPFGCQLALRDEEGVLVGLALLRTRAEGHTSAEHRRLFRGAASSVRAAVRLQMMIEDKGRELLHGALDAIAAPALLVDGFGRVGALTPAAERLLASNNCLGVNERALATPLPRQTNELNATLAGVLHGVRPEATMLLRGTEGAPLRVRINALPRTDWDLGFRPRAIIIVEGSGGGPDQLQRTLQLEFGLTGSEADVAVSLASGVPPAQIAEERATSLGTVRHQIKSVFGKLYVSREAEFLAVVDSFKRGES